MEPGFRAWRRLVSVAALATLLAGVLVGTAIGLSGDEIAPYRAGAQPLALDEEGEQQLLERDFAFSSRRTAGDNPLDITRVGELNAKAMLAAKRLEKAGIPSAGPATFESAWMTLGPNPIAQVQRSSNTFAAVANLGSFALGLLALRRGAAAPVLAVRSSSIVFATLLAGRVLAERVPPARIAGSMLVFGGVVLLAL